jgi:hypothetical protein
LTAGGGARNILPRAARSTSEDGAAPGAGRGRDLENRILSSRRESIKLYTNKNCQGGKRRQRRFLVGSTEEEKKSDPIDSIG